jgi:hypothetical protein
MVRNIGETMNMKMGGPNWDYKGTPRHRDISSQARFGFHSYRNAYQTKQFEITVKEKEAKQNFES